jgi:AcrR family transcriptional regulator
MATDTRERIIKVAHDLFYERGFHGVGLESILDEVGVTKTTFYNHFESKDALVVDALRWHDAWWRNEFAQLLRKHGGDAPRDRLLAIFDAIDEVMHAPGYKGCIFINVAVQYPACHDPAHVEATVHKGAMKDLLAELAAYAGATEPRRLAEELALVMEGVYVSQQVVNDPGVINAGKRLAQTIVDRYIPAQRT